jgi:VanZ family protein
MKRQDHSGWRRDQSPSRNGRLGPTLRYRANPWLAGLWLAGAVIAVILSIVPGSWISLTRHFPDLPPLLSDAILPLSHLFGYAILVGSVSLVCQTRIQLISLYIGALAIGAMLEILQILIPNRGISFGDFVMNVLGASAGLLFGAARLKRKSRALLGARAR